jgi:HEAT repeat protein
MIRFQDLSTVTDADIEAAIARDDPNELPLVPLTVTLLTADPAAAAAVCSRLAGHEDPRVRANAIVSLGHLARRFRSLDEKQVRPVIEAGLRDDDEGTRSAALSAADEIHQFLHWTFPGHTYGSPR